MFAIDHHANNADPLLLSVLAQPFVGPSNAGFPADGYLKALPGRGWFGFLSRSEEVQNLIKPRQIGRRQWLPANGKPAVRPEPLGTCFDPLAFLNLLDEGIVFH